MHQIEVTADQLLQSRDMAVQMGRLHNSITRGQGNIAGFIGEILVRDLFKGRHENTYDYDLVLPDGATVDVKTKRTSVAPKDHYECSIAALNTKQACDFYAFMRVKNDYSVAWFLGIIPKDEYFDLATFRKKGEVDPDNGYVVKSDCYNLSIAELWKHSRYAPFV